MAAVGGDIEEIRFSHPTLGSGVWFPKANEDSTFDPGGYRNEDDDNMVDGGGRSIIKKNRIRWSLETKISWDANVTNELLTAKNLAASPAEAEWIISHSNGTVWKGTGTIVGDIKGGGNDATMDIKISGGQEMKKILG